MIPYALSALGAVVGFSFLVWVLMHGWLRILAAVEASETRRLTMVHGNHPSNVRVLSSSPDACPGCRTIGCQGQCGLSQLDKWDGLSGGAA